MVKLNKQHWVIKALRNYIAYGIQQQITGAVILTVTAPYDDIGLYIITAYHTTANTTLCYVVLVANGATTLIRTTTDAYGGLYYTAKQTNNTQALSNYILSL